MKARKTAVAAILLKKPNAQPGKSFAYSNVGFTVAAAMVEEKTGTSWEELMRQELFVPLSMPHAGFGPPNDGDIKRAEDAAFQIVREFAKM